MFLLSGKLALQPVHHCGSARESLPAAVSAAEAEWPGGVDYVMSNLRVGTIYAAIQHAVQDDAAANAGADRDVDEVPLAAAGSPSRLSQCRRVGVIFERDGYLELSPRPSARFPPSHPGRKSTLPTTPLKGSIGPVHPIPTPEMGARARPDASRSMAAIRLSASSNPRSGSVGDSTRQSMTPCSSTMPAAILVPPMSTAPITLSTPRLPPQ